MLDYQAIEAAVRAEKNAGGFADLMKKFQALGVLHYDYIVADGFYRYYDEESYVTLQLNGVPKKVNKTGNRSLIKTAVLQAQAGTINFEEFCQLAGEAGVCDWRSDLIEKNVTYYDKERNPLLMEPIPGL